MILVAPCTRQASLFACQKYHYSKSISVGKNASYGVWENGIFIGAVVFGIGANNNIHKPYNLEPFEICELTRVALNKHQAPVSQIVSLAIKMLKKDSPKLRLIISYADTEQGHNGAIYQAMNWVYEGKTKPDFYVIDNKGHRWHSRLVSETGYTKQFGVSKRVIKKSEGTVVYTDGKHKYLYPLDKAMKKTIEPLAQPYPKREQI